MSKKLCNNEFYQNERYIGETKRCIVTDDNGIYKVHVPSVTKFKVSTILSQHDTPVKAFETAEWFDNVLKRAHEEGIF